jgi:predicted TIM-barrel fold metal-dependent hydrolase
MSANFGRKIHRAGYTKREFLALAWTACAAVANPSSSAGHIDAHVHVWTPDKKRYLWDPRYRGPAADPASFTPEQLFEHTRPAGVSRVVLIQMSFYGTDNSYMLDAMKRYPSTFSGVAVVDAGSATVRDEMVRLMGHGVRGFRITPDRDPKGWLETEGMSAMWKCGAEHRLAMSCLIGADAIPSVDRMSTKFPETPVVIDHLARIGVDGKVQDADVRALCDLSRHRNLYVKVSAFYALGRKQYPYTDLAPMIRRVYESFGPQRLMWASDSPFQVQAPHTYAGSLELVRDRLDFLNSHDREWLLGKTAEQLFFASS